jgi:hypothetical protein
MLTIKEPIRYQKPAEVPAMSFDAAIGKMCKVPVDCLPVLDRQRAILVAERDRHMREINRLENVLWGLDRAIEILGIRRHGQ